MRMRKILLSGAIFIFIAAGSASANVNQIKFYKEAFPGESPKCMTCHIDKVPKKDGKHDLNPYGLKVKAENPTPTAETYKKVGKAQQ